MKPRFPFEKAPASGRRKHGGEVANERRRYPAACLLRRALPGTGGGSGRGRGQFLDWRELEKLVCGTPVIDVALLKRITSYNSSMPDGEKHPVAALFWEVMEGLPNEDRAQVMAFAWGRRRMPPQVHRPPPTTRPSGSHSLRNI